MHERTRLTTEHAAQLDEPTDLPTLRVLRISVSSNARYSLLVSVSSDGEDDEDENINSSNEERPQKQI